jgi:hypothetical protein
MATIHLHRTTSITAEQYIAALTYFGPGRSKLFGNSADEYLKVHQRACRRPTSLKAREASGNACTMTGRIPTVSYLQPPTPMYGAAPRGTLTLSPAAQTVALTLMLLSYGTART